MVVTVVLPSARKRKLPSLRARRYVTRVHTKETINSSLVLAVRQTTHACMSPLQRGLPLESSQASNGREDTQPSLTEDNIRVIVSLGIGVVAGFAI